MNAGRLWTIWLWAICGAALVAGTDLAARQIHGGSAGRRVLLLPENPLPEERRGEILAGLLALPETAGARWISPSDLAQEAAAALERDRWPEIFPEDATWLPWVAELTLRSPFRDPQPSRDRVRTLRADPEWRMVIWDERAHERDRAALTRLLALAGAGGIMLLILGSQAVRHNGTHTARGAAQAAAQVLPAAALTAGLGGLAWVLGIQVDARAAGIAAGMVLLLAGVLPSVLKSPLRPLASDRAS